MKNTNSSPSAWPVSQYGLILAIVMAGREVADIGQFSPAQRRILKKAVRRGELSSSRAAGPYPTLKTCYAAPHFDFEGSRQDFINTLRDLADHEARGRTALDRLMQALQQPENGGFFFARA